MLVAITICEIAFWVVLAAGLFSRYVLKWTRFSTVLLVLTPAIDIVLLVFTFMDLTDDGQSRFLHGVSAFYIGFSITHGPKTIAWADRWAAYRWGTGPKPTKTVRYGADELRYQWREFGRAAAGSAIAAALLVAGLTITGLGKGSFWLTYWMVVVIFLVLGWFVAGPLLSKLRPKKQPADSGTSTQ